MLTVTVNPGYLTPSFDFIKLIETAFDIGLHLDNFCSYCEVIKSETSFHCTICKKCVELFDHHCPFINGCLGYRNHKFFLLFIFFFMSYLLVLMTETIRHFVEIYKEVGIQCIYTDSMTTVNLVLIFLHLPVMGFQLYNQCRNLSKKPELPPQFKQTLEYRASIVESENVQASQRTKKGMASSVLVNSQRSVAPQQQDKFASSFTGEADGNLSPRPVNESTM